MNWKAKNLHSPHFSIEIRQKGLNSLRLEKYVHETNFWQTMMTEPEESRFEPSVSSQRPWLLHTVCFTDKCSLSSDRAELKCEKPPAIGFLKSTTWLLHISEEGCLHTPDGCTMQPPWGHGSHCSPFPTAASWAFSLNHVCLMAWSSLFISPSIPIAEHIPFPNSSKLWSLIFPSVVSERSIQHSNLEILLMKTNEK